MSQFVPQLYDTASLQDRGMGRASALASRLNVKPDALKRKRILEVGCGFGEHCAALQDLYEADVVGIDPWPRHEDGPYKDRGCFRTEDITSPTVSSLGSFDFITSYDVLEHIEDPEEAIKNIVRLLKPGGKAFLKFNLYRGANASHVVHLTQLPWAQLLYTFEQIQDIIHKKTGRDTSPAWVNKLTYAHYLLLFDETGVKTQRVWYVWKKMSDDFYASHIEKLKAYPRYELDRDFMCVVLKKPKNTDRRAAVA